MTSSISALRSLLAISLVGVFLGAGVVPAAVVYTTDFGGDSGTTPANWTSTANLKLDGNGWYANATGHSLSYLNPLSLADGTIETDYIRGTSFAGIVGRLQDTSNFYHVRVNGTNLQVYRFGLGGNGTLGSVAISGYDSYPADERWNLSATFLGPQITATLRNSAGNVVSVLNVSDPGNQLAGKAGVRGSDGAMWDNFAISDVNRATFAITTADGVGADAQIEKRHTGTYDTQNFGTTTTVQLKNANDGSQYLSRKSYFRFDLGSMEGFEARDVTLELTASSATSNSYTFNVFGLIDGHAGESWTESGPDSITWNNAPGNDTASLGGVLETETVFLGQISTTGYSASQVLQLASPDLADFLNADTDGRVTLILTQFTQFDDYQIHSNSFHSKEGSLAYAPRLIVHAVVPEPSTLVLAMLGMFSLAICRRRRMR